MPSPCFTVKKTYRDNRRMPFQSGHSWAGKTCQPGNIHQFSCRCLLAGFDAVEDTGELGSLVFAGNDFTGTGPFTFNGLEKVTSDWRRPGSPIRASKCRSKRPRIGAKRNMCRTFSRIRRLRRMLPKMVNQLLPFPRSQIVSTNNTR